MKLDRRKKTGEDIQRAFRLLRSFASVFKVKIGEFEVGLVKEGLTGDLSIDLTDLFIAIGEAAKRRKTAALILLDEIQYLTIDDLSALIISLHKISQKQLPLLFFGAGLPQIARLTGEAKSYSERLFEFPEVDKLDKTSAIQALVVPVKREKMNFTNDALDLILKETDRYPYFLQVWGSHTWEIAKSSPFKIEDVEKATLRAIEALDQGFFKVRIDRLSERQLDYVHAMGLIEFLPANSTAISNILGISVKQAAPIRDELIKKGIAYSPARGLITFTVPGFKEFVQRSDSYNKFAKRLS